MAMQVECVAMEIVVGTWMVDQLFDLVDGPTNALWWHWWDVR